MIVKFGLLLTISCFVIVEVRADVADLDRNGKALVSHAFSNSDVSSLNDSPFVSKALKEVPTDLFDKLECKTNDDKKKKKKPKTTLFHINDQQFGPHDNYGYEHRPQHGLNLKRKHGRSIGALRVHKKGGKKKSKELMKLMLIGAMLKAKIDVFLKIFDAQLRVKLFIIMFITMLINIAKLWMDLKKVQSPQKVIHYKHAQHQHHYDDHAEGWSGDGNWKRSLDETTENAPYTSPYSAPFVHRYYTTE